MRSLRCGTALLAGLLAVALTGGSGAQEKKTDGQMAPPVERKAIDTIVKNSLRDVINRGADIYNAPTNDYMGCYHLYEGALMVVKPLLDHRPGLQKDIDMALAAAAADVRVPEKAYHLRRVMDKIRAEIDPATAAPVPTKTLWMRLGGDKGVSMVVDDLLNSAAADPKVNLLRPPYDKLTDQQKFKLRNSIIAYFSKLTGGPIPYTGKDMKDAHKGMMITNEQFDAFAGHLKNALVKNNVMPDDVKTIMTAVEGTRKDMVEPKAPAATLWDRLGGKEAVAKVVDDLFDIAGKDPKVNFFRTPDAKPTPEQVAALKKSVIAFISTATGGPKTYTGKSMKESHKGMMITNEQFDAFAVDLKKALDKNGVKPEDAKALLDIVETTRKDIVEKPTETPPANALWMRLGGEPAVAKVVDDLFDIAGKDPKVNFFRTPDAKPTPEQVAALKKSVIAFISTATGGPKTYTGKSMKESHKGMMITNEQFDAFAVDLKMALDKNGVKPEDAKALLDIVETTRKDIVEKTP